MKVEADRLDPLQISADRPQPASRPPVRGLLTQLSAENADLGGPAPAQLVDAPLQPGQEHELDRKQRDRRGSKDRLLYEHEGQDGQERPALKYR